MTSTLCVTTVPSIVLGINYAMDILPISICFFPQFLNVLQREIGEVEKNKDAFLADFTQVMHQGAYQLIHGLLDLWSCFFWEGASDFFHSICCWQEDYDDIVNGWNAKLKRSSAGEQRWGLFIATKWFGLAAGGLFGIRMDVAVTLLLDRWWFSLEAGDLHHQNKNVCCCVAVSTPLVFLLLLMF